MVSVACCFTVARLVVQYSEVAYRTVGENPFFIIIIIIIN